jgi:hypothetical protein
VVDEIHEDELTEDELESLGAAEEVERIPGEIDA